MVFAAEIKPNAYYDDAAVCNLLSISTRSLNAACQSKELPSADRAGRRFFRGQWLIDWLESPAPEATRESEVAHA